MDKEDEGDRNQENRVLLESDTLQKTPTEEVFSDVFENIQMQLDMIDGLREKPWTMKEKLEILRNAKSYVDAHSGDLNRLQHFKESRIRVFRQIKRQFQNFIVFFIPWEKRIKNIQGYFGAGIGSFFLFLRSLVWMNFVLLTFITIFVIVPQLMSPSTAFRIPESEERTAQRLTAVLDAKGYLEYSFLFYGYYGNELIQVGGVTYPLPLAYFVVFMGTYFISIIIVLRAITREQRMVKSSGQGDQYPFGGRVFSAWDFLITERETAENKLASLTTAIREQILEAVESGKAQNKKLLVALRVMANILVLGVLSASAYLIYLVVKRSDEREKQGRTPTVLEQYEISLAITGMNAVCPVFFKLIAMIEQYHPRTALYWELTRIMFLYLGNMYVLVISLLNKINQSKENSSGGASLDNVMNQTITDVPPTDAVNSTTGALCWETAVGQELFKLTMIDLVALVFSVLTGDLIVSLVVRFLNCFQGRLLDLEKLLGYPEFKLAENVLQLINSQGLIWMGLVFSPGLIMLNILKLVVIMYLRSWAVMVTNVPPQRIFKASHKFYLILLLVMLFLCMLAVGYAAVEIEPSQWCGPFRGKRNMYTVLTESIDDGPALLDTVFDYLSGPSIVVPVFILMTMAIYYYRSKANYFQNSNRELLLQLHHERTEDRKKLFKTASEHVKRTTGTDENSSRSCKTASTERKDSHSIRNETTRDNSAYERPGRGRAESSSSIAVDQTVSGTVEAKTAKREDFLPIVTYEGNEDTKECSAKASTTYTHREVNVIVHKSSSSSSSTCSSVRSIDQRRHASLCSYGTLRHQVSSHHQTSQGQIRLGECDSTSNKDSFFKQNANDDCTHTDQTTTVKCEETVELQVLKVPRETIGKRQINESKQNGTNLGGSLGAMFDF
ncbi:transmembrane channel-like protein 3 [Montipora capricornis]|uniref:transmembrane channel-like protein 3 n=1 Tax=Montipora capricornis TaxID=246305 RepID=UPI0035F176DF